MSHDTMKYTSEVMRDNGATMIFRVNPDGTQGQYVAEVYREPELAIILAALNKPSLWSRLASWVIAVKSYRITVQVEAKHHGH